MTNFSRRSFLKQAGLASGCLLIGINTATGKLAKINTTDKKHNFNNFLKISEEGEVIVTVSRSEMGQGIRTSMVALIADELDVEIETVRIEQGEGNIKYGNQNTDGSRSIRQFYNIMRKAGASAKMMLITSAARKWSIKASDCYAKENYIYNNKNSEKFSYGELAKFASTLKIPENPKLKHKKDFKYIGKELKNADILDIITGKAVYGIDTDNRKMLYAAVKRCPVFDGNLLKFNAEKALAVSGVKKVVEIKKIFSPFSPIGGVAVIADSTWSAFKARDLLEITWDYGKNEKYNSNEFTSKMENSIKEKVSNVKSLGNIDEAFKKADKLVESTFNLPHLAHATMEPLSALASVKGKSCEIWAPTQDPQGVQDEVSKFLGISKEQVKVNVTFLGGGFGRKSKPDFILEAVALSKEMKLPIKIVWSREDDIKHDFYHTVSSQYLKASLDKSGNVTGWLHRAAYPTILSTFIKFLNKPADFEYGMGMTNLPFDIKNVSCEVASTNSHVRIGWLRSVCNIFHAFSVGVFIDELADKAGKDPVEFRLKLVGADRELKFDDPEFKLDTARYKNVLKKVAQNANWGKTLKKGEGIGVSVHYSFYSYVAHIIEVENIDNKIKIKKVYCVIDCGNFVNKDAVKAQMEGGIIFALSIAKYGKITAKDGIIEQSSFDNYPILRMMETPEIEIEIIENDYPPSGVGETGVPSVAPALVNAIYSATGKRYYNLPLEQYDIF